MTKLDDKINNKIYNFETRRTGLQIIVPIVLLIGLFLISFFSFQVIWDSLAEQSSLDVLEIFQEDIEVIRKYYWEAMSVIYHEIPKINLGILLAALVFIFLLIWFVMKNFSVMKNRMRSILNQHH